MSEKDAKHWRKLAGLFPPSDEQREKACLLYQQFIKGNAWALSQEEILELELPVIFDFYYRLALFTTPGRVYSRKQSPNWFAAMHVYQIDLREISGWLGLLKLAPLFSHQAVAIEPFCLCAGGGSRLVTSHISLDEMLHSRELEAHNISLEDFLPLVFEALRRLKIAIGFILYPFVSSKAIACQRKSEIFQQEEIDESRFFNFEHPDAAEYLTRICEHYARSYGFDFVYYDFSSLPDLPVELWQRLETQSRITPSFAVLGGPSMPFHQMPPYLLQLSADNLPLSKIKIKDVPESILPLICFLGMYTSIYPCLLTCHQQEYFSQTLIETHSSLPVFDRRHNCYERNHYTVWVWGSKHRIAILLAVWEDQEAMEIDLSEWIRGDSFYQQIIWTFEDQCLRFTSDELVSTTKIVFNDMKASQARVVLINV